MKGHDTHCETAQPGGSRQGGKARSLSLFALLLAANPLFASEKARTFRIHAGVESIRVVVPKVFEPLLPGSVYPNRRKPVAPRALPVAIIDPGAAQAEEFLLERRFVVVERKPAPIDAILKALETHPEADTRRLVALACRSFPDSMSALKSIVIFDPDLDAPFPSASSETALFLLSPARSPSEELTERLRTRFGSNAIEKWYRSENGFPDQAFRDAAEWSAIHTAR